MRIAIGALSQETNSFSPVKTTREHFTYVPSDELIPDFEGTNTPIGGFIDAADSADVDVEFHPLFSASAMPNGPVDHGLFEEYVDEFVDGVRDADLDAVLLSVHGSMTTEHEEDPEGELLVRVRKTVGDVPVVATFDHHASITQRMVDAADALVGYLRAPHTDTGDTGRRAARLTFDAVDGRIDPVTSMVKAPMICWNERYPRKETARQPLRGIFDRLEHHVEDNDAALDMSFSPCHTYTDASNMSFTAIAVTDGAPDLADELAEDVARQAWDLRGWEGDNEYIDLEEAIDRTLESEGRPTVFADRGDNPLNGAPGDSPEVARRFLEGEDTADLAVVVPIVDAETARTLAEHVGERVTAEIGGQLTPEFEPLPVDGVVRSLVDEPFRLSGDPFDGRVVDPGTSVLFEVADTDVWLIVGEKPGLTVSPSYYAEYGLDSAEMDVIVVKSGLHFQAGFESLAAAMYMVETPGICSLTLTDLPYERCRPAYPFDEVDPTFQPYRGWRYGHRVD
jgi:microcystin degradation protein MlrC